MNYYNEFDLKTAAWLQELIYDGQIPDGYVDTRSISDVRPSDLAGFTQCHFFAGIGGWSLALRRAGWPDSAPVWTGSCPCQPFSNAGKGDGFADERHLWPHFLHLIRVCRPSIVLGEQVASKDGLAWLDLVATDLEGEGYATAAADLCAAGVGAPHIRQRLYWVGHANNARLDQRIGVTGMAGREGRDQDRQAVERAGVYAGAPAVSPTNGHWRDADWLLCRDGKWRPVEPGTFPLAHGIPSRVVELCGYGNAIVPQVAQTFIEAVRDCL